ncbi:MAG: adenosylcobinamide-GDP ribazoletransferase [Acidimicrobiales bacterium]
MRRALSFLTPFGRSTSPSPAALNWFGVVGCLIGLAVGGVWWLSSKAWAAPGAAALALAADVCFTGYLHLDGLADAADGLIPPLERARRLEAMADPAVGAFGIVTVAVVLLLRFGAFASSHPAPLVVGALWCASRTAMAEVTRSLPYARPGGLASAFMEDASVPGSEGPEEDSGREGGQPGRSPHRLSRVHVSTFTGLALAVALAYLGRTWHGVAALAAELLGVAAVVVLARRRIGGFTGDVLGAAGVVGETVGLLVLVARW